MPLALSSLPFSPKYDGVRLFLPAFPFLALLAGVGGEGLAEKIRGTRTHEKHFGSANYCTFILAIIILGGLANLRGAVLGALFLILLPEFLRFVGLPSADAAQLRQVIYGLILIFLMLYRPQGLLGEYKL